MRAPCSVPGCEKPSRGRGWCGTYSLDLSNYDARCRPRHRIFDGAGKRQARGDDGRFVTLPHDSGQRAGVIL